MPGTSLFIHWYPTVLLVYNFESSSGTCQHACSDSLLTTNVGKCHGKLGKQNTMFTMIEHFFMMIESSKSIVQIHGLLLRQYKAVWTSNIQHEANVYFISRMFTFFPPQRLNDITYNHQNTPFSVYQQKTFHNPHTPLHPVFFKKKTQKHASGLNQPGCFFCSTFQRLSRTAARGMLERRLGTHQQTALGRLGSFGSGVLGRKTFEVNFWAMQNGGGSPGCCVGFLRGLYYRGPL